MGHRGRSVVIEFFCGLGGVAEAIRQSNTSYIGTTRLEVGSAIDIDRGCGEVYEHNFGVAVDQRTIESLDLSPFVSDENHSIWWLSPPCQPYCRRGRSDALRDPRCEAIHSITEFLSNSAVIPSSLTLENVPEFARSADGQRLLSVLHQRGYATWSGELCPTQFGIPNRRLRYYLVAQRDVTQVEPPRVPPSGTKWQFSIAEILDDDPAPELFIDPSVTAAYRTAMDVIDPQDAASRAACFASGYGKSIIRCGSYLQCKEGLRRFSPQEVARLLGFSPEFAFPEHYSKRRRWKMLGNSVSVPVVRVVLASLLDNR